MAKEIVAVVEKGAYDLIIAGRESIDYNGGMVPGMISALIGASYVNNCVGLEIDGGQATAVREIDGGKETVTAASTLGNWRTKRDWLKKATLKFRICVEL